jgi:ferredoxin
MRLKPRTIKQAMFTCTQCAQCIAACETVQYGTPTGSLLAGVSDEAARQNEATMGLTGSARR